MVYSVISNQINDLFISIYLAGLSIFKYMVDLLQHQESKELIVLYVQVLSLIFLIVYVWKTWQMASATRDSAKASEKTLQEMKEARDQESAPYVVPYISINQHMMFFGIKNTGKAAAENIKLILEPELKSSILGDRVKELSLIRNGVSSLPPGHEIGTIFDVSHVYLTRDDFPKKYSVKVIYFGGLRKEPREYEQILDLSVYNDLIPNEDKKIDDIVEELKNLSKVKQRTPPQAAGHVRAV